MSKHKILGMGLLLSQFYFSFILFFLLWHVNSELTQVISSTKLSLVAIVLVPLCSLLLVLIIQRKANLSLKNAPRLYKLLSYLFYCWLFVNAIMIMLLLPLSAALIESGDLIPRVFALALTGSFLILFASLLLFKLNKRMT